MNPSFNVTGKNSRTVLNSLRTLLREAFEQRRTGVNYAKLVRAHGYIDGFMQALIDSGMANRPELLQLVRDERSRAEGPATQQVVSSVDYEAVA